LKIPKQPRITETRIVRELKKYPDISIYMMQFLLSDVSAWSENRKNSLLAHLIMSGTYEFKHGELDGLDINLRFLWMLVSTLVGSPQFQSGTLYEHLNHKDYDQIANYLLGMSSVQRFNQIFSPLIKYYQNQSKD
jgi:hypothetical protein